MTSIGACLQYPTGDEHNDCMVDLGRGSLLKKSQHLILDMPMLPNAVIWGSLQLPQSSYNESKRCQGSACPGTSKRCSICAAWYYTRCGRWNEAVETRKMMQNTGVQNLSSSVFTWLQLTSSSCEKNMIAIIAEKWLISLRYSIEFEERHCLIRCKLKASTYKLMLR